MAEETNPQQGRFITDALATVERERYRSYSEVMRDLHWLATAVVALFALLYSEHALLYLSGYMALYTAIFHYLIIPGFGERRKMQIEGWIDLLWITVVVGYSGAAGSPLFFLYYLVVYASTPSMGRGSTYLKAGAATLLGLGVSVGISLSVGASLWERALWSGVLQALIWPVTGLWLVAYFSAESTSKGATLQRSLVLAAHTDELTGIPNMRYFTNFADARDRLGEPYAIVMVDADYLKRLNDQYGHARGSQLICRVAEALEHAARRGGDDVCSRLGGDEFIVRLAGADGAGALAYCKRVRRFLLEHPLTVDEKSLSVSVSMGIAAHPEHGGHLQEVIRHADEALYESKRAGRGRDSLWRSGEPAAVSA